MRPETVAEEGPQRAVLPPHVLESLLFNEDLAPTTPEQRTWSRWNIAALWIGMSVCTTTYMLASSLIASGMTWLEAVLTVLVGNLVVLVPMVLNAHAGTKYGIPFPILVRASFGLRGSNVPAMLRAIVACGWFGIQTWIGGSAIYTLLRVFFPAWPEDPKGPLVGINLPALICFLGFWAMNVYFIVRGTESIKWLETLTAPFLILVGIALLAWGATKGGGLGHVLDQSKEFSKPSAEIVSEGEVRLRSYGGRASAFRVNGGPWLPMAERAAVPPPAEKAKVQFRDAAGHVSQEVEPRRPGGRTLFTLFLPMLTAMVGYWATLSLNIPDFTRFARSQKDQALGQLYGLPTTMALYAFIGVAVTCASVVVFRDVLVVEDAPWDPVKLLGRFTSPPVVVISMIGLLVATLTTNIAANVVSPANDISNLAPRRISFRMGGMITALIGIAMMPWKLIETTQAYIFKWLIGYGALLGPIGGIMIADYFVVRRRRLDVAALYDERGRYGLWNGLALSVLALAVAPSVPGFLVHGGFLAEDAVPAFLRDIYTYAWFVGFGIAFVLYSLLRRER